MDTIAPWLLIAPALTILSLLFVVPLVHLLILSLSPRGSFDVVLERSSVANYAKFLTDPFYLAILWKTMKMAFTIATVSLVAGYPLAYYMVHSRGRKRAYLTVIVISPLLVNVLALTFGWYVILGPTGIISSLLQFLRLANDQVNLLFSETAVVVGLGHVFLSYMVLSIASSLQNMDPALPLAAQSLGASRMQAFLKITLPLSMPGIIAGWLILFTLSASAFATPALLGGSANKVMSFLIYQQAFFLLDWPMAGATAFILMFSVAVLVFLYVRVAESGKVGGMLR